MKKILLVMVFILITCACSPSINAYEPILKPKETQTPSVELFDYYDRDLGINIGIPQGWLRKSSTTQIGSETNVPVTSFFYQSGSGIYYLTLMTFSIHKNETPRWIVEDALGIGSSVEITDFKNFQVVRTDSKVKIDGNSSYIVGHRGTQISTNKDFYSVTVATETSRNEWLLIQFSSLEQDKAELEKFVNPILLSITFANDYTKDFSFLETEIHFGSAPTPKKLGNSAPCSCSSNLYNCDDFDSRADAIACYDYCYPSVGDIHWLDDDKDLNPCEPFP